MNHHDIAAKINTMKHLYKYEYKDNSSTKLKEKWRCHKISTKALDYVYHYFTNTRH